MPAITEIPHISTSALMDRYSVLLLDAYGVLVHGGGALPDAVEFIDALNRAEKPYYILTNDVAKLPATAAVRYRGFGLDLHEERIISAGTLLKNYFADHALIDKRCVVLGPRDSERYVEMAGGRVVAAGEHFEVLVIADETGFHFLATVDTVLTTLFAMLDRRQAVSLILPNPDLIFPTAEFGFGLAAGSIALVFEAALRLRYPHQPQLCFARLGKPHAAIFNEALRRSGNRDMVMIGDQLETDIRGANAFGIDSVLVTGGVSGAATALVLNGPQPTYLLASLAADTKPD